IAKEFSGKGKFEFILFVIRNANQFVALTFDHSVAAVERVLVRRVLRNILFDLRPRKIVRVEVPAWGLNARTEKWLAVDQIPSAAVDVEKELHVRVGGPDRESVTFGIALVPINLIED